MPLSSWLFLRGSDSIWVERPHGFTMLVAGPGRVRDAREFPDEAALQEYQARLASDLTDAGWFLWDCDRERRLRADRRQSARSTTERRQRESGVTPPDTVR